MFFLEDVDAPRLPVDAVMKRTDGMEFFFAPSSMRELFRQFPWPDVMWMQTAKPLLMEQATRDDIPFLLERLRLDTRLATVFIDKGWTADAIPVLRELAKDRIPMGKEAIVALAGEKDASLDGDLAPIALHLKFGLSELEPALRAQPGFDWPKFATDLWRRKKYSTNWLEPYGEFWQPALWAAQERDFSAFRQTVEQAAHGKKWETEQLKALTTGEYPDLIGFLRENIGRMKFDPATRKWGL